MSKIPHEGMSDKFSDYLQSIGSFPQERMPEVMADMTLTHFKFYTFEATLEMIRQSVKNISTDRDALAAFQNAVQARLAENSNTDLGISDSQRQQFQQALL